MRRGFLQVLCALFVCVVMALPVQAVSASALSGLHKIMEIDNWGGVIQDASGDLDGVDLTLNGEALKLRTDFSYVQCRSGDRHIDHGVMRLMSRDGSKDYLSFPMKYPDGFLVFQFQNAQGKEFLLIQKEYSYATGRDTHEFWIIGKSGDKYITYATLDGARQMGLLGESAYPTIRNGELHIRSYVKGWEARQDDGHYAYQGHPAHPVGKSAYVNSVAYFWDDNAQWFGVRLVD